MVYPYTNATPTKNSDALSVARELFKILLSGEHTHTREKLMIRSAYGGRGRWAAGVGDFTVYLLVPFEFEPCEVSGIQKHKIKICIHIEALLATEVSG